MTTTYTCAGSPDPDVPTPGTRSGDSPASSTQGKIPQQTSGATVSCRSLGCVTPSAEPVPRNCPNRLAMSSGGVCNRMRACMKVAIGVGNASAGGVALDGQGCAYVTNFHTGALNKVDLANGKITETTNLGRANSVALDGRGFAYVTNLYGGMLYRVELATGLATATAGDLEHSAGVAVDAMGKIVYVVSARGRLYQVEARSGLRTEIVSGLDNPWGLALDTHGSAYITTFDGFLHKVQLETGEVTQITSGLGKAYGVALDGAGQAYIPSFTDGTLLEVDLGTGGVTEAASGLGNPCAVALDKQGAAYVTNTHGILWKIEDTANCGAPRGSETRTAELRHGTGLVTVAALGDDLKVSLEGSESAG